MKNAIQDGCVMTVAAPTGGITSGSGVLFGNLFGIAATAAAEGEPLEVVTTGVFRLAKASAAVLTMGSRVAWNAAAKAVNVPASGRGAHRCCAGGRRQWCNERRRALGRCGDGGGVMLTFAQP